VAVRTILSGRQPIAAWPLHPRLWDLIVVRLARAAGDGGSGLDYVPLRAGSTFTGIRLYLYFFSSTVGVYDIRYRDATIVGQGVPALAVDEVLL